MVWFALILQPASASDVAVLLNPAGESVRVPVRVILSVMPYLNVESNHRNAASCVVEGYRFDLHPADNTTEFRLYMNRSLDERESLQTLVAQVSGKRALIVDIGANCGVYSIPLIDAAAAGFNQPVDASDQSGLASPRGSNQSDDLPCGNSETDIVERLVTGRVSLGYVRNFEQCVCSPEMRQA